MSSFFSKKKVIAIIIVALVTVVVGLLIGNNIANTYATKLEVNAKANKATTLAGYGITDAVSVSMFNAAGLLTYEELA